MPSDRNANVLSKGPVDLLFVEAAVNDSSNIPDRPEQMLRGMEGVACCHARETNPLTDIVHMHFVMPPHMADYRKGQVPASIEQHDRSRRGLRQSVAEPCNGSHRPNRCRRVHLGQGFQRSASVRVRPSTLRQQYCTSARMPLLLKPCSRPPGTQTDHR